MHTPVPLNPISGPISAPPQVVVQTRSQRSPSRLDDYPRQPSARSEGPAHRPPSPGSSRSWSASTRSGSAYSSRAWNGWAAPCGRGANYSTQANQPRSPSSTGSPAPVFSRCTRIPSQIGSSWCSEDAATFNIPTRRWVTSTGRAYGPSRPASGTSSRSLGARWTHSRRPTRS